MFGLEKLDNLQELKNLDEMQNLQKLDQLEKMNQMEHLDKLEHLERLPELRHMDQLQHIEGLDKLKMLDQLQHLDKLSNLHELSKMQNLETLKHLENLHHMDRLQQLQMLNRMGELERLNQLQNMQVLKNLDKLENLRQMKTLNELPELNNLQYMQNLQELSNLHRLQQLEVLNRLKVLDRILAFNFTTLLYLLSLFIPGLVFQETIALLTHNRLGAKRALVMMAVYNVLNLLICLLFVFKPLSQLVLVHPMTYYMTWLAILVLAPVFLGCMVAILAKIPRFGRLTEIITAPRQIVTNAWERFLTDADSYRVVITLTNEEKIMGIFQKGMVTPVDPNDLYFTETSHYDPQATEWKELEQPMDIWVKGSEIKMVEVSPQEE